MFWWIQDAKDHPSGRLKNTSCMEKSECQSFGTIIEESVWCSFLHRSFFAAIGRQYFLVRADVLTPSSGQLTRSILLSQTDSLLPQDYWRVIGRSNGTGLVMVGHNINCLWCKHRWYFVNAWPLSELESQWRNIGHYFWSQCSKNCNAKLKDLFSPSNHSFLRKPTSKQCMQNPKPFVSSEILFHAINTKNSTTTTISPSISAILLDLNTQPQFNSPI